DRLGALRDRSAAEGPDAHQVILRPLAVGRVEEPIHQGLEVGIDRVPVQPDRPLERLVVDHGGNDIDSRPGGQAATRSGRGHSTLRCRDCSLHGVAVPRGAKPWRGVVSRAARRLLRRRTMRISDVLSVELILPAIAGQTKDEIIDALAARMAAFHPSLAGDHLANALRERERQMSTALVDGVAIPHARVAGPGRNAAALARRAPAGGCPAPPGRPTPPLLAVAPPPRAPPP